MPPKRKGATAQDESEAPPAKLTKGNKEEVGKGSSSKSFKRYTREEYNRFLARLAECRDTVEEAPVNFQKYIPKTKILPGSLEKELEKYKQYVAIGYNYFYKEEIASGKMKARENF